MKITILFNFEFESTQLLDKILYKLTHARTLLSLILLEVLNRID